MYFFIETYAAVLYYIAGDSAMVSSEHYKRYAMQCLEMARTVSDERQRAFLIEMAHAWKKLADHAAANKNLQDAPVIEEPDRGD